MSRFSVSPQGKQFMRDSSAISRSFVVSFFTQRHPQTKTNITDRNDGLIDGTKSMSRWDFEEFNWDFISVYKSFSFTATERLKRLPRQLLVKLDPTKIWLRKTSIFSYIKIWRKAAQAVDLGSLLRFPLIDVEGRLFNKRPCISFFF